MFVGAFGPPLKHSEPLNRKLNTDFNSPVLDTKGSIKTFSLQTMHWVGQLVANYAYSRYGEISSVVFGKLAELEQERRFHVPPLLQIPRTSPKQPRNISELSPKYHRNTPDISPKYLRNIPETFPKYMLILFDDILIYVHLIWRYFDIL